MRKFLAMLVALMLVAGTALAQMPAAEPTAPGAKIAPEAELPEEPEESVKPEEPEEPEEPGPSDKPEPPAEAPAGELPEAGAEPDGALSVAPMSAPLLDGDAPGAFTLKVEFIAQGSVVDTTELADFAGEMLYAADITCPAGYYYHNWSGESPVVDGVAQVPVHEAKLAILFVDEGYTPVGSVTVDFDGKDRLFYGADVVSYVPAGYYLVDYAQSEPACAGQDDVTFFVRPESAEEDHFVTVWSKTGEALLRFCIPVGSTGKIAFLASFDSEDLRWGLHVTSGEAWLEYSLGYTSALDMSALETPREIDVGALTADVNITCDVDWKETAVPVTFVDHQTKDVVQSGSVAVCGYGIFEVPFGLPGYMLVGELQRVIVDREHCAPAAIVYEVEKRDDVKVTLRFADAAEGEADHVFWIKYGETPDDKLPYEDILTEILGWDPGKYMILRIPDGYSDPVMEDAVFTFDIVQHTYPDEVLVQMLLETEEHRFGFAYLKVPKDEAITFRAHCEWDAAHWRFKLVIDEGEEYFFRYMEGSEEALQYDLRGVTWEASGVYEQFEWLTPDKMGEEPYAEVTVRFVHNGKPLGSASTGFWGYGSYVLDCINEMLLLLDLSGGYQPASPEVRFDFTPTSPRSIDVQLVARNAATPTPKPAAKPAATPAPTAEPAIVRVEASAGDFTVDQDSATVRVVDGEMLVDMTDVAPSEGGQAVSLAASTIAALGEDMDGIGTLRIQFWKMAVAIPADALPDGDITISLRVEDGAFYLQLTATVDGVATEIAEIPAAADGAPGGIEIRIPSEAEAALYYLDAPDEPFGEWDADASEVVATITRIAPMALK